MVEWNRLEEGLPEPSKSVDLVGVPSSSAYMLRICDCMLWRTTPGENGKVSPLAGKFAKYNIQNDEFIEIGAKSNFRITHWAYVPELPAFESIKKVV